MTSVRNFITSNGSLWWRAYVCMTAVRKACKKPKNECCNKSAQQLWLRCKICQKAFPVRRRFAKVKRARKCTLGLNNPGNHTECGVEMLPAVQLLSCSYLLRTSCKSAHQGETASQQLSAHDDTLPSLTMYQDVNESTSWYRVDTCAIHKAGTVLVAIPASAPHSASQKLLAKEQHKA